MINKIRILYLCILSVMISLGISLGFVIEDNYGEGVVIIVAFLFAFVPFVVSILFVLRY